MIEALAKVYKISPLRDLGKCYVVALPTRAREILPPLHRRIIRVHRYDNR